MTEKEVLTSIGVTKAGVFEDNVYVIELESDAEWGKIFSLLEKSDLVEEVDGGDLTGDGGTFYYEYDTDDGDIYYITLSSSFDEDIYKLEIEREK